MRIAMVDDQQTDLEYLKSGIARWERQHGISPLSVPVCFDSGEAFLMDFQKGSYDIIFLDIYMKELTGMETARRIRETDPDCHLVFTTSAIEFAAESYEVSSAFYLVKPYPYEKLSLALDRCNAAFLEERQSITVPGEKGDIRILLHSVLYTECVRRRIIVHCQDGSELTVFMSLKNWAEQLKDFSYFCDCMRGIFVNLEAVEKLKEDCFLLNNGQIIPISRLKYRDVREQFLQFSYDTARKGV